MSLLRACSDCGESLTLFPSGEIWCECKALPADDSTVPESWHIAADTLIAIRREGVALNHRLVKYPGESWAEFHKRNDAA
jgi:hypothetical protein